MWWLPFSLVPWLTAAHLQRAFPLVSLRAEEGALTDQRWGDIANDFVDSMGFTERMATERMCFVLITREAFEDADWPIADEVSRVVQDAFSRDLDLGLLGGTGAGANPLGVTGRADEAVEATLTAAVAAAVSDIGESGWRATHVALSPTTATEAAREGSDGHPVYPQGISALLGLTAVPVPGLASPRVYDAGRIYAVVARDFRVERSTEYESAFRETRWRSRSLAGSGLGCLWLRRRFEG